MAGQGLWWVIGTIARWTLYIVITLMGGLAIIHLGRAVAWINSILAQFANYAGIFGIATALYHILEWGSFIFQLTMPVIQPLVPFRSQLLESLYMATSVVAAEPVVMPTDNSTITRWCLAGISSTLTGILAWKGRR